MSTRKDFFLFFFFMYIFLVASEENRTFYRMEIARIETERRNTYVYVRACVCVSLGLGLFFKRIGFLLVSLLRVLGEGGDTRLNGRCCWMNI